MQVIKYIALFVFLVLLQGLVLNNILFFGYLNPYLYILFILFVPFNTDKALLLITAFLLGLSIDMFENSGGMHAAACTLVAFARQTFLKMASGRRGIEFNELRTKDLAFQSSAIYAFLMVFTHHFVLFGLEAFKFTEISTVLVRTLYSSLFTFVLVMLVQLWNFRSK